MINDGRVIFFFCCAIEGVASAAASAAARSKRIKTVLCDDIYKNDQVITLYQIFGLFASPRRDRWWECAHRSTDSAESSSLIIFVSFKKETSCHTHNRQSLFCLNSRKEKRHTHRWLGGSHGLWESARPLLCKCMLYRVYPPALSLDDVVRYSVSSVRADGIIKPIEYSSFCVWYSSSSSHGEFECLLFFFVFSLKIDETKLVRHFTLIFVSFRCKTLPLCTDGVDVYQLFSLFSVLSLFFSLSACTICCRV